MVIIDDFESGTLGGWNFSGDADWVITSNPVYEGSYAAKAGTITYYQITKMYRSITVTEPSTLSFYWKVSSRQYWDYLNVYIDGTFKDGISGEVDWTLKEIILYPGTYELRFEYEKYGNFSEGSDTGYIDYITLEPDDTLEPPGPGEHWIKATPSANWPGKYSLASVVHDGKMWVLGGSEGPWTYSNDVWHSSDGITWIQATASAGWSARQAHTSVVYDGKIWVMGGYDGSLKNDVWYSTDGITWIQATASAGWSARSAHTSVVHDGKMWVLGGSDKNDVWYSTDGITWMQATSAAGWSRRGGHTSVVHDGKMWVMGGYDVFDNYKGDVWHSTDGITWTQATASANWTDRDWHASVAHDNKMWVMGGENRFGNYQKDVWYSTDGVSWTRATASAGWSARVLHKAVVHDNKIWILGGHDGNYKNDVWYTIIIPITLPVYVNSSTGDDLNAGDSCTDPVKTFGKAYNLIGSGGTIIVCNSGADFSSETVTLNKSFNLTMEGTGYFYGPKAS
ncbi:MAG: hypothetical protein SCH70_07770 [Candidatus Methanoperedens sp.]|nr:hypothetical protein [Candidatus Methanoperedens sp.]